MPVGAAEDAGDDVGDVEDAGDEEDLFDALVVAFDDEGPDESGAQGHADVLGDVKELHASGDAGELRDHVAEVDDDEQHEEEQGDAQAELFADEIAETFAGDGTHAGAHFLHDDKDDGDGDHRPEQAVTVLGACLGVGEDAAGIVIDVGGDEAGAEHGEEQQSGGAEATPGEAACLRSEIGRHASTLQVVLPLPTCGGSDSHGEARGRI